jgi:hypothetical protein
MSKDIIFVVDSVSSSCGAKVFKVFRSSKSQMQASPSYDRQTTSIRENICLRCHKISAINFKFILRNF